MNANLLKSLAIRNGMSMVALSEKTGIAYGVLIQKTKGKRDFKASEMFAIKDELGIDDATFNLVFNPKA